MLKILDILAIRIGLFSIVIRLLEGWADVSYFDTRFLFSKTLESLRGPSSPLLNEYRSTFPRIKRPKRKALSVA